MTEAPEGLPRRSLNETIARGATSVKALIITFVMCEEIVALCLGKQTI
jgi:hypothetical protein